MAIEPPNPEADEAHDIVMKQRGYDPIAKAIDAAANDFMADVGAKAAMWDMLFDALENLLDKEKLDDDDARLIFARIQARTALDRARAIK